MASSSTAMRCFERYVGIDYSGAETPTSSLKGLQVFVAGGDHAPVSEPPPPSAKKYWTRREIGHWLVDELSAGHPTLVGIDHGFSFPVAYFKRHGLPLDWPTFLDDFQRHWPTDGDHMYVDFVRDGAVGNGAARTGSRRWRRLTELCTRSAKSVFHFDVQGSVAKSTHAGLPWLKYLRERVRRPVHFWPFDGWRAPDEASVVVEVYPRLWREIPSPIGMTAHEFDAFVVADTLRAADLDGRLTKWLAPDLSPAAMRLASIEGWIIGGDATLADSAIEGAKTGRLRRVSPGTALAPSQAMPEISRFFGIVIGMYYEEHGVPHFHARTGRSMISVEIGALVVRGEFPGRAITQVLDWAERHRAELLENWDRARQHLPLVPIPPLE